MLAKCVLSWLLAWAAAPMAAQQPTAIATPTSIADRALLDLQRQAEAGVAQAQYRLALAYERGDGVARDLSAAAHWYSIAANHGFPPAQNNLAAMYAGGTGVIKDESAARRWYTRASIRRRRVP